MITIVKSVTEWNNIYNSKELPGRRIGLVPTMGALHAGHLSLIERSIKENDVTVLSIFVNPTQFNDTEDLKKYPRNLDMDIELLKKLKVDYVFFPDASEIYSDDFNYYVEENNLSKILCGPFRPGHFKGVLTVVMKLLNIIKPAKAYFGEKDYQQLKLIEGMVKAFFLDVEIVACPIIRDDDGLALSSRNALLSDEERKSALNFPKLLKSDKSNMEIKKELVKLGMNVDYIEEHFGRRFGAVHVGKVRLIDNVRL